MIPRLPLIRYYGYHIQLVLLIPYATATTTMMPTPAVTTYYFPITPSIFLLMLLCYSYFTIFLEVALLVVEEVATMVSAVPITIMVSVVVLTSHAPTTTTYYFPITPSVLLLMLLRYSSFTILLEKALLVAEEVATMVSVVPITIMVSVVVLTSHALPHGLLTPLLLNLLLVVFASTNISKIATTATTTDNIAHH